MVSVDEIYCRVPTRWGLRPTTLAPGSDKTRVRDPLGPLTGGRNLTPTRGASKYVDGLG